MKRLLIYVGYPKAASTTLQNGVFLALHRQKKINFLGRAFESDFYGIKSNKHEYKKWFKEVVSAANAPKETLGNLSEEVVNLLSEGLFMMNERHSDQLTGPRLLHDYFSPVFNQIEILIVVRSQTKLIPSYYVQNYRKIDNNNFSRYIEHNLDKGWPDEAKIFDFQSVVREYANIFGKDNVHTLLFEDFVQERERFSAELAEALDVDAQTLISNLGESRLNQTRNEGGMMVVRKLDKNSMRASLIKKIEKINPKWAENLRIKIPALSDAQKSAIFESFGPSNLAFAEEFGLDKQAMRKYGYF